MRSPRERRCSSMSGSRSSGSSTSTARSRFHGACSSSSPTPPAPNTNPSSTRAGRVIVYCRSGTRGALAALTLKTLGYEHVANLDGGFSAWKEAGLPADEHHADI